MIKRFLEMNGWQPNWTLEEIMKLGRMVDKDVWKVDEIENWLRDKTEKLRK